MSVTINPAATTTSTVAVAGQQQQPSPAIVFGWATAASQGLPTETMGPAYAAREVGLMNVNSGQTVPVYPSGANVLGTASPTFNNAQSQRPMAYGTQSPQYFLGGGGGYSQGQIGNLQSDYWPSSPKSQQYAQVGQFYAVNRNIDFNSTQIQNQLAQLQLTGQQNADFAANGQFVAYGNQALYLQKTYVAPNINTPNLGGSATPDRAWLTVINMA